MTRGLRAALPALCLCLALAGCVERPPSYKTALALDKSFAFRPGRLAPSEDRTDHPCLRGNYNHVWETDDGRYGRREVWLCCVPPDDIIDGSFDCGSSAFPTISIGTLLGGGSDYWKIRSCSLLHPTETEPTFVPVCIPAPEQAPGIGLRY